MADPLKGFDADQDVSHVAPLAISRGVRVFFRYLKNLSRAEVDAIFDAGKQVGVTVYVVSIYETTADRALQGAGAGAYDVQQALTMAARVGQPQGSAIYFAGSDFDEQASQDVACKSYYQAVKDGMAGNGKMGDYGNGALNQMLRAAGIPDYTWDAGGQGMRGTKADEAAGNETVMQDVGDKRDLDLGISIDSDLVLPDAQEDANGIAQGFGGWSRCADPVAPATA